MVDLATHGMIHLSNHNYRFHHLPWGSIYVGKSSYAENHFGQGNRKNEYDSVVNQVGNF